MSRDAWRIVGARELLVNQCRFTLILTFFAIISLLPVSVIAQTPPDPALPAVFLDTTYAPPTGGTTRVVNAGGDFQAALNNAQPGDIIELEAGATFTGNFVLPNKGPGTNWIYIQSSAIANLPPPGTRVTPNNAIDMPKIVSPNTDPAIVTELGAHHYRFVGIEITTTHSVTTSTHTNLIYLECSEFTTPPNNCPFLTGQTQLAEMPTDITFDRCYIHGTPTGNVRRGIAVNGARLAVIDSHLSDFHEIGADSQAIAGWNGTGPFKIVNNYLEGAGENVMFGGGNPTISGLVPSDIEIRRNHFFKPLSWKVGHPSYAGINWVVKNIFELKNAQRVLVDSNIFENNWGGQGQDGFAILFTVRNSRDTPEAPDAPWSVVQDVTFVKNIVRDTDDPARNTLAGVNILGFDNNHKSEQTKRILIKDNLFDKVGWRLFQLLGACSPPEPTVTCMGTADIVVDHNTLFHNDNTIIEFGGSDAAGSPIPHTGFVFRNNISHVIPGWSGVHGDGTGEGTDALETFAPGYVFVKNVLQGANCNVYPPDNFCPATWDEVQFVDQANGNYRLAPTSPYKNAGTDSKDIGADIDAVETETAGVISGSPPPPPADTTPPVISAVSASVITSSGATITWATDEPSDSQVEYGTTTAYGSSTAVDTNMVTSHSQTLSGLTPNTLYHYRVKSRDAAGNLATSGDFTFTTLAARSPFLGTPFAVPGTFQAEDFDLGGEGVAYHDMVPGNAGGEYRPNEDVDIVVAGGNGTGYRVNNIQTGEWISYTISVAQTGTYRIEAHVSSQFTTSRFHVEIDGVDRTGSILVPDTGLWSTFQWVGVGGVDLSAGEHILSIHSEQEYFDLDAIRISAESASEIILDNAALGVQDSQRTFTGEWCISQASDFFGTDSLFSCGPGTDTYRWTPTIPATVTYDVYVWWSSHPNRSTNVPVTVVHAGGSTTQNFNQQIGGGQWVLHGRYTFNAGTAGYVETSDINGQAAADAVRWVPVP